MYVISKDGNSIVNMDHVTSIYIGADGCTVKADFANGKGYQLGRYDSMQECLIAVEIVAEKLETRKNSCLPSDSVVSAKLRLVRQEQHHISGKKTKSHGGS